MQSTSGSAGAAELERGPGASLHIRHGAFLQLLLKESLTKAQVQHIFAAASKKLEKSESKMIAGCVMETKKWVVKKFQNMKTGAKSEPAQGNLLGAAAGAPGRARTGLQVVVRSRGGRGLLARP